MQNENSNEQKITNIKSESSNRDKIKTLLKIALFMLGALLMTSCSPAKADGSINQSSPSPSFTPLTTATLAPKSTPKPTLSPIPKPTPEITREEALKQMNIISDELYSYSSLVIYECTLKDGSNKVFLGYTLRRTADDTFLIRNVTDNELFGTFKTDLPSVSQYNRMDEVDITLVPEFLKGAKINTTYGVCSIPDLYEAFGKKMPESEQLEYIAKYVNDNVNRDILTEQNVTAIDCANLLLDLFPIDEIVVASDYIEGYVPVDIQGTPKVK